MKVNDPDNNGMAAIGKTQPSMPLWRGLSEASGKNDDIELSSLSRALAVLQANSPQRDARMVQLSAELGGGSYIVDYHAVSGSLIRETLAASLN